MPEESIAQVAYLDNAATTRLAPEVLEAMMPFLTRLSGNPSGSHAAGRLARRALDDARGTVAELLGRQPGGVVWTSGGTEADNLAIAGVMAQVDSLCPADRRGGAAPRGGHVLVCSAVEHHAVLEPVSAYGGVTVGVDRAGRLDLDRLAAAIGPATRLVSVMLVNNELGTVNDLAAVREVMNERAPGALLHTDAVQAPLWLDLAAATGPADLVSLCAHKIGGPVGVGALVVAPSVSLRPLLLGGGQERGRRSGTQNTPGAVGLAAALRRAADERTGWIEPIRTLRDWLAAELVDLGAVPTVPLSEVVAGFCPLVFPGVVADELLWLLDEAGVAASAGASCASGAARPSHVLAALGLPPDLVRSGVRLSLAPSSTAAEVRLAREAFAAALERLRPPAARLAGDGPSRRPLSPGADRPASRKLSGAVPGRAAREPAVPGRGRSPSGRVGLLPEPLGELGALARGETAPPGRSLPKGPM